MFSEIINLVKDDMRQNFAAALQLCASSRQLQKTRNEAQKERILGDFSAPERRLSMFISEFEYFYAP